MGKAEPLIILIAGYPVPPVTLAVAMLCVLAARPFTPRGPVTLPLWKQAIVTLLLMLLDASWVIDHQPGILMTVIVSIGLGYGGFSIIELAGEEMKEVVRNMFSKVKGLFTPDNGGAL